MKCEPWMNYAPFKPKTARERAHDDALYWKRELDVALKRVDECRKRFDEAVEIALRQA